MGLVCGAAWLALIVTSLARGEGYAERDETKIAGKGCCTCMDGLRTRACTCIQNKGLGSGSLVTGLGTGLVRSGPSLGKQAGVVFLGWRLAAKALVVGA